MNPKAKFTIPPGLTVEMWSTKNKLKYEGNEKNQKKELHIWVPKGGFPSL